MTLTYVLPCRAICPTRLDPAACTAALREGAGLTLGSSGQFRADTIGANAGLPGLKEPVLWDCCCDSVDPRCRAGLSATQLRMRCRRIYLVLERIPDQLYKVPMMLCCVVWQGRRTVKVTLCCYESESEMHRCMHSPSCAILVKPPHVFVRERVVDGGSAIGRERDSALRMARWHAMSRPLLAL